MYCPPVLLNIVLEDQSGHLPDLPLLVVEVENVRKVVVVIGNHIEICKLLLYGSMLSVVGAHTGLEETH